MKSDDVNGLPLRARDELWRRLLLLLLLLNKKNTYIPVLR